MAGFKNIKSFIDAFDAGQTKFASWRKQPTQTTASNIWFDLSMSPGNPIPNYYIGVPGQFTRMARSTDSGIDHGGNVAPKTKHLKTFHAQTATATAVPLTSILYDCVGFYPFIDESVTGWQYLDNTTTPSRYLADEPVATLGPELAVNGDMASGTAGYTSYAGATITNVDGALVATSTGTSAGANQVIAVDVGSTYVITYRLKEYVSAAGLPYFLGSASSGATSIIGDYQGFIQQYGGSSVPSAFGLTRTIIFTARNSHVCCTFLLNGAATVGDTISLEYLSLRKITKQGRNTGLSVMPIVVAAQIGGGFFAINYTNQDGIPNRVTFGFPMTTQSVNGTCLLPGAGGPFVQLQQHDTGVRSIEAVQMLGADIGLFAAALVRPIADHAIYDITAPAERDYVIDSPSLPVIPDDAYLNLVVCPNGTLANAPIYGTIETIWN
jgi:hypothetical protein